MERREGIDRPNEEAMSAFSERAADGPVFMLNLLEFQPDGGAERYGEYGEAVAPLFARAGGKPIFAGRPAESLIGEGSWDLMVLVSYPDPAGLPRDGLLARIPGHRAPAHARHSSAPS